MQLRERVEDFGPPPPPPRVRRQWALRRHHRLIATKPERLSTLTAQFVAGTRMGWSLPWRVEWRSWEEPVGAKLLLAFCGALVEGCLSLRRQEGGLAALERALENADDQRWLMGTRWEWTACLGLRSRAQVSRLVDVAVRLELVEQQRTYRQVGKARGAESTPAYRCGRALLEWIRDGVPPWERSKRTRKNATPPESSDTKCQELPEVLHSPEGVKTSPTTSGAIAATPQLARVVGRIEPRCLAPSAPQAAATLQQAVGRGVHEASRAEAPQEAARLHRPASPGVSAGPATPPAPDPSGVSAGGTLATPDEVAQLALAWLSANTIAPTPAERARQADADVGLRVGELLEHIGRFVGRAALAARQLELEAFRRVRGGL
jgi:hypothetical protein